MENVFVSDQHASNSVNKKSEHQDTAVPVMDTALAHVQLPRLAMRSETNAGVTFAELPVTGLLTLRARDASTQLQSALQSVVQLNLPEKLQSNAAGDYCIRWVAPDEWLLSCPVQEAFNLESSLRASMGDASYAITNVSGGFTTLLLHGPHAQLLLQKSTPYDVHPINFTADKVVNTVFAKAQVCLRCVGDSRYEIIVRRSFADYIWHWLQVASTEYGLGIEAIPSHT